MKMKVTFKPLRKFVAIPIRVIAKKTRTVVKPAARLKNRIWRGLQIHAGSWKSFRRLQHERATAPFHCILPAPKLGPA